jgi:hypothetical protein
MRLRTALAALVLAGGIAVGGAYAVAQSAAETAVAEAIARLRAVLGPEALVEHGAIRVEPIAGRVRLASLTITPDRAQPRRIEVADVVADGLRPGGGGFERLSLHAVRLLDGTVERGRVGSLSIEGVTLPAGMPTLDDLMVDSLDLLDVSLILPDGMSVHLAYVNAANVGGDRADSYEIQDLIIEGQPGGEFERFEIGTLDASGLRLVAAVRATLAGEAPPVARGPSALSMTNLVLRIDGRDVVRLAELTTTADDAPGQPGVQTTEMRVAGLSIGLPPEAAEALGGLEVLALTLAGEGSVNQEAGDYDLRSFRIEAEGLGVLEMELRLSGIDMSPQADPAETGRLHRLRLVFEDQGLVARAIAGAARAAGMTEPELRREIATTLAPYEEALRTVPPGPEPKGQEPELPNSKLGQRPGANVAPVTAFLERPGRIEITAEPAQSMLLAEIGRLAVIDPADLIRTLLVRVLVLQR